MHMPKVRLESVNGHYVATGEIMPFDELPKVLTWGLRVFLLAESSGARPIYRESFTSTVMTATSSEE